MNESEVKAGIERAIAQLFGNQPDIFDFTSETGQTEWNLAHHLAVEIHRCFPSFDCDLDVIKRNYENRRPDMVLHKRGTHKLNFLVVEIKLDGNRAAIEEDIEKIREYWFREPLHYEFGAVVSLRTDLRHGVSVLTNAV